MTFRTRLLVIFTVAIVAAVAHADVRLTHARIPSANPAQALRAIAAALGLPDVYAASQRVKGSPGRFENLWLEGGRR